MTAAPIPAGDNPLPSDDLLATGVVGEVCRGLFFSSLSAMFIGTEDGRILHANAVAAQMFGYTPAEMRGMHRTQVVEFPPGEEARMMEQRRTTGQVVAERIGIRRDGSRFPLLVSSVLFAGPGGLAYAGVSLQDLTERKLAQTGVAVGEERFRVLVDALFDGVVMQDARGSIYAWNPRAEAILGLTGDQLRGRTSIDPRWRAVHEDGSAFPGEEHPAMVALRTAEPVRDVLMGVHKPDGSLTWILVNANPLIQPWDTAPYAVVTSFSDVTARRLAEAEVAESRRRMYLLLDQVPAQISHWDCEFRCLYANTAYKRAVGLLDRPVEGMHARDILGPERLASRRPYLEAIGRGEPSTIEADVREADGRMHRLQLSFLPELHDGRLVGAFVVGIDVTGLSELVDERTRELREAMERAESSNRLKDQFLANVSHEMRTPLHGILAFSSLGVASLTTETVEKGREYFARIEASGARLTRFVDDLLSLARLQARRVQPHPQRVDLLAVLESLRDEYAALLAERQVRLTLRVAPEAPRLEADASLLRRVLLNLLSNARKYSPRGGEIEVLVDPARLALPQGEVDALFIRVEDQGPGIPDGELETVFERFVQSSRTDGEAGGTGLGLAICREIVHLHRGTIRAANRPGGGASLQVLLPAAYAGEIAGDGPTAGQ